MRGKPLWLWLGTVLALWSLSACIRSPLAPGSATPTARPATPTPARRGLRIFVAPQWGPQGPDGQALRQWLQTWSSAQGVPVQVRTFTPEEMQRFLQHREVAPAAVPDLMLIPHEALDLFSGFTPMRLEPPPDPQKLLLAQQVHPGLPWVIGSWGLWVPRDAAEAWAAADWAAWSRRAWTFPGARDVPYELWQLYRVAGGGFPPNGQNEQDRKALRRVLVLVNQSLRRQTLPEEALTWPAAEVPARAPEAAWLLSTPPRPAGDARLFLFPNNPEGETGPLWVRLYLWLPGPAQNAARRQQVEALLQALFSPVGYAPFVSMGWLPALGEDVPALWAPQWPEAVLHVERMPPEAALAPYTPAWQAALTVLFEQQGGPEEAVVRFFENTP